MDELTIAQLTSVAGITAFAALISEIIWRTSAATEAIKDRFGPLVAVIVGIATGIGAGFLLQQGGVDLAQSALNGLVGGLASMGIHDLFSSRAGLTANV